MIMTDISIAMRYTNSRKLETWNPDRYIQDKISTFTNARRTRSIMMNEPKKSFKTILVRRLRLHAK